MLLIRLRVSPWRARCSPRSDGRVTTIEPSSCLTVMARLTRSWSSPLGPLTLTRPVSTWISTPSGRAIGCFPMRLTGSPDLRHELAAHPRAAGVMPGHDAARGRDDRGAHAALDLGHVVGADVLAPAGPREALQAVDDRAAVLRVLEPDVELLAHAGRLHREVLHVALLLQDPRELRPELRRGHHGLVLIRGQRVPDPGEEVCDRVGLHAATSSTSSVRGCTPG